MKNIKNLIVAVAGLIVAFSTMSGVAHAEPVVGSLRPYVLHHADGRVEHHHGETVTTQEVGKVMLFPEVSRVGKFSPRKQSKRAARLAPNCNFVVAGYETKLGKFDNSNAAVTAFTKMLRLGMSAKVTIACDGPDILKVASN